jgi:heme/copper-type cytochrome/quinol oxidase subunit 2
VKLARCLFVVIAIVGPSVCLYGQPAKDEPFVATVGPTGVQRVEVLGGNYWFEPNHIVVRLDVPVELSVSKESGAIPHDISMKSPEAGMDFVQSLRTTPNTIRFTPTKTGVYPFYCSKISPSGKTQRERGMEGVIEVVP